VPFVIRWIDEAGFAPAPTASYGIVLAGAAVSYIILQTQLVACNGGPDSRLARALGSDTKGKISISLYLAAIALAFVRPWLAIAVYVAVALLWLIPDRRIEALMPR